MKTEPKPTFLVVASTDVARRLLAVVLYGLCVVGVFGCDGNSEVCGTDPYASMTQGHWTVTLGPDSSCMDQEFTFGFTLQAYERDDVHGTMMYIEADSDFFLQQAGVSVPSDVRVWTSMDIVPDGEGIRQTIELFLYDDGANPQVEGGVWKRNFAGTECITRIEDIDSSVQRQ